MTENFETSDLEKRKLNLFLALFQTTFDSNRQNFEEKIDSLEKVNPRFKFIRLYQENQIPLKYIKIEELIIAI